MVNRDQFVQLWRQFQKISNSYLQKSTTKEDTLWKEPKLHQGVMALFSFKKKFLKTYLH